MRIGRIEDLDLDAEAVAAFAELVHHLRHGRAGKPWCTWAVASLDARIFLIGDARGQGQLARFESVITRTADSFAAACTAQHHADGTKVGNNPHATLTILLERGLPLEPSENALQGLRPELLRRGMMMALLHPESPLRALTPGPEGYPYRISHPFLTVRWAVPGDEVFVGINPELAALLSAWLRSGKVNQEGT